VNAERATKGDEARSRARAAADELLDDDDGSKMAKYRSR